MWRAMLALLVVVMTVGTALAGEPKPCGGIMAAQCNAKQFCQFPINSHCGQADRQGRCEARPEVCTMDYKPVCGCDGKTYSNRCMANAAGADVLKPGAC